MSRVLIIRIARVNKLRSSVLNGVGEHNKAVLEAAEFTLDQHLKSLRAY